MLVFVLLSVSGIASIFAIDQYVEHTGRKYVVDIDDAPASDAIIVFGARVFSDGRVSDMLADRLNHGLKLYEAGKAPKIIVSGDHGTTAYDEVNTMRKYLQDRGVPREDIFMDHAGFDTYNTLYRARDIFLVEKAILVTQEFHLLRALYIAKELNLKAYGVGADTWVYPGMKYYRTREVGARVKAFLQAGVFKPLPKYLGEEIPIWKNGEMTDDEV